MATALLTLVPHRSAVAEEPVTLTDLELVRTTATTIGHMSLDRRTLQVSFRLTVLNTDAQSIEPPFFVALEALSPGVTALNADMTSTEGIPLYRREQPLPPGQSIDMTITLQAPSRARFSMLINVYSPGMALPPGALPSIPTVHQPHSPTGSTTVSVSGKTFPNLDVCVISPVETVVTRADGTGDFAADVAIATNRENRVFVSAKTADGRQSGQNPLVVIHDTEPPALFVDLPAEGSEVVSDSPSVTVTGRVGDRLTGFLGLEVEVTSSADGAARRANVAVGIGTNGTFECAEVPLAIGENTLTVVARDELGNTEAVAVRVSRRLPVGPTIKLVSGNGQTVAMHQWLPAPIIVQVRTEAGAPLPDKVVTFQVTRSDGILSATSPAVQTTRRLRLSTDAQGQAQAFWRLGSDAGCGNNRITVTSAGVEGTTVSCASATAAAPDRILIGGGNNQVGGSPAPERLSVWVCDGCNGAAHVPVTFTVKEGGGRVDGELQVVVPTDITGHASVAFEFGAPGPQLVEAEFEENPGFPAVFTLTALDASDRDRPTTLAGLVLDNASQPIGGAACSLGVAGESFTTVTGEDGGFEFSGIPPGPARLHVDGLVATSLGGSIVPQGSFPALAYELVIVAHAENVLGGGPVLLPPLDPANARTFDGTSDVDLTVEGIAGLVMTVHAGSMTRADGTVPSPSDPATLSLNQIHVDDMPMALPDGAAPGFAWTLQPSGARFDPPVDVQLPNVLGLPPGAVAYFLSFDHDVEKFAIVATATVTEDGRALVNDPGTGIPFAGWTTNCPPYPPTGRCENEKVRLAEFDPKVVAKYRQRLIALSFMFDSFSGTGAYAGAHLRQFLRNEAIVLGDEGQYLDDGTTIEYFPSSAPSQDIARHPVFLKVHETLVVDELRRKAVAGNSAVDDYLGSTNVPFDFYTHVPLVGTVKALPLEQITYGIGGFGHHTNNVRVSNIAIHDGRVTATAAYYFIDIYRFTSQDCAPGVFWPLRPDCWGKYLEQWGQAHPYNIKYNVEVAIDVPLFEPNPGPLPTPTPPADDEPSPLDGGRAIGPEVDADARVAIGAQKGTVGPGSLLVPNVPATPRPVRVNAIRREQGVTWYGRSEPVEVQATATAQVAPFLLQPEPLTSLRALAASVHDAVLTTTGQTTQVHIEGTMSDGSVDDLSASDDGTTYVSSNPAIASVDTEGVVTANGNGTASITAFNDGAAAVTQVAVSIASSLRLEPGVLCGSSVAGERFGFGLVVRATPLDEEGVPLPEPWPEASFHVSPADGFWLSGVPEEGYVQVFARAPGGPGILTAASQSGVTASMPITGDTEAPIGNVTLSPLTVVRSRKARGLVTMTASFEVSDPAGIRDFGVNGLQLPLNFSSNNVHQQPDPCSTAISKTITGLTGFGDFWLGIPGVYSITSTLYMEDAVGNYRITPGPTVTLVLTE